MTVGCGALSGYPRFRGGFTVSTELDLSNTTDAMVWAEEFMRLFADRRADIDAGLMVGWFANAMAAQQARDRNRAISAVGYVSADLAARADAWNGNAPEWFPEPPEWLTLAERGWDEASS
jgi:hypothetical protein